MAGPRGAFCGGRRWRATPLVDQLRGYVADPEAAVGWLEEGTDEGGLRLAASAGGAC